MSRNEFNTLAADMVLAAGKVVRHGRGAGAKVVDAAAADAQQLALAQWTTYGRGRRGAAGTFRGRMSRNRGRVRGYVMGDDAAFYQEDGTAHHPPQPAAGPAVEKHADAWGAAMLDAGAELLS